LALKEEPVQVFDKTALKWIVPRKNPGFAELVNCLAHESAKSQGLKRPLTTFERLVEGDDDQKLYILWQRGESKPMVFGYAKVTRKQLYLRDREDQQFIHSPLCVMEFYVLESAQRQGQGLQLFKYILENEEQQQAYQLAFDNPSKPMLEFLSDHFECSDPHWQSNRFVVFDKFFEGLTPKVEAQQYSSSTANSRNASRQSSYVETANTLSARNGVNSQRGTVADLINGEKRDADAHAKAPGADTPQGRKYNRDYGHQHIW